MIAFVISDVLGQKAGAYLATWLLCRELWRLGIKVTCIVQNESWEGSDERPDFEVIRPCFRRGCRWDWPGRCLAWQVRRRIHQARPGLVVVVGVIPLARYLLNSDVGNQLLIWELTNANRGNKFVDQRALPLLPRCRAMLSPARTIDQNIRQTYGYQGPILRLPFWIEDRREEQKTENREQRAESRKQKLSDDGTPTSSFSCDFVFLGRRDVEKGLNELVRATALVVRKYPDVRVLIGGAGVEEPFASLARQQGVTANVTFRFFPTRAETLDTLARSRFLVLPSYHEGYPLVLLEAAQCSVPFIATRVGSIPELYGQSPAALLVPPHDEAALAEAMLLAMGEPAQVYAARRAAAGALFRKITSAETVRSTLTHLLEHLPPVSIA